MIKNIVSDIKDNLRIINTVVSSLPQERRAYYIAAQKTAKMRLEELNESFREEVVKNCTLILVSGLNSKAFCDKLVAMDPLFTAYSVNDIPELVASKIDPMLYTNPVSNSKMFGPISSVLEEVFISMGIREYNQIIYKSEFDGTVRSNSDLVALVKNILTKTVGLESVGIFAARSAADRALKDLFEGNSLPVVIYTDKADKDLLDSLKKVNSERVAVISTSADDTITHDVLVEEVNEEDVEKAILVIMSKINKKGNQ